MWNIQSTIAKLFLVLTQKCRCERKPEISFSWLMFLHHSRHKSFGFLLINNYKDLKIEPVLSFWLNTPAMWYRMFRRFWQSKFAYGCNGCLSQYTLLPQLPLKIMLSIKVFKIVSNIINSICQSKSVTHSVVFCFSRCYYIPRKISL